MTIILYIILPRQYSKAEKVFGLNQELRDENIIISITSFPARMNTLSLCIETLFRQTCKADKIILWLTKEEFKEIELPRSLLSLCDRGLDIRWIDDDLKAHKKYFYAFKEFENDLVVTFDDDIFYPNNVLETLIELHKKFPKAICANRVHFMSFENGTPLPYRYWRQNYKNILKPSKYLMATGVCGVLYPPKSISKEVFNVDVFKKICFLADDVWLKFCGMINDTEVVTSKRFNKDFITIKSTQKIKLVSSNVFEGGNDKQIKDVMNYFNIKL